METSSTALRLPRLSRTSPCMSKLDRLGWKTGFSFKSNGARVGIRSNDPELLSRLRDRLPPTARSGGCGDVVDTLFSARRSPAATRPGQRNYHLLYLGVGRVARSLALDEIVAAFENSVHLQVATHARRCLFVHAAVLGWCGRAILLPGRTHTGKTTLTAALIKAGAEYYSDEYAVIDPRGHVHPYLKPLTVRNGAEAESSEITAGDLGGREGRRPLPVGLVASLRYSPGTKPRLRELTQAESVVELLANTVAVRLRPELTLALLQRATKGARAMKGRRSEAEAIVPRLIELMSRG